MRLWRSAGLAGAFGCLLLSATACGGSEGDGDKSNQSSGGGPTLGGLAGQTSAGSSSSGGECAGQLIQAKRIPLDMYVMLDVSGSMSQATDGDPNLTKWQAVSSALTAFVSDGSSAGIGVGLQLFPLKHPDAPASCSSNNDCADFGRCFSRTCWGEDTFLPCDTDAECSASGACIVFGECQNDDSFVCRQPGGDCGMDEATGAPLGACLPHTPTCTLSDDCRAVRYATPAVPIAELPGATPALVSALAAAMPDPTGLTPSGPALAGAISLSSTWAKAHPERQVVAVLATDGMPTLEGQNQVCAVVLDQAQIDAVAQLAGRGKAATPSITTFVIGVIGPQDTGAAETLQSIARAGGSTQAFIVDTRGDVQAQFRNALDQIREAGLSCELAVPQASNGGAVDYGFVNVDFTRDGKVEHLLKVDDAAGCAAQMDRGWYYDVPAGGGSLPSRILACPATCSDFKATAIGSVQISLGCQTRTVVK
jgi:hypothetical protein